MALDVVRAAPESAYQRSSYLSTYLPVCNYAHSYTYLILE